MQNKKKNIRHGALGLLALAAHFVGYQEAAHAATNSGAAEMLPAIETPAYLGGLPIGVALCPAEGAPAEKALLNPVTRAYDLEAIVRHLSVRSQAGATAIDPIQTSAIVPGVFGSVAIPMHNFPVTARWKPIYRAIAGCPAAGCGASNPGFSRVVAGAADKGFREKLDRINRGINGLLTYRRDKAEYGRADHWAPPAQSLKRGAGDCEDFAILKMAALVEVGIPAKSMSLVVLQDKSMGVFHAVLAVSTGSGTFILDNTLNTVVLDTSLPSYVPLYSFSTDRAWIHGSRKGGAKLVAFKGGLGSVAPGEGPGAMN